VAYIRFPADSFSAWKKHSKKRHGIETTYESGPLTIAAKWPPSGAPNPYPKYILANYNRHMLTGDEYRYHSRSRMYRALLFLEPKKGSGDR
jgi:hypothetical protein